MHNIVLIAKHCKTLLELNLSSNKIGDKGVISISILLTDSPKLEKLDISANNIRNFGDIINALQKNSGLRYLNLSANPISDEYLEKLQEIANSSETLEKIDLRKYDITENDFAVKTTETSEAPLLRFKTK